MYKEIISILEKLQVARRGSENAKYKYILLVLVFQDILDGKDNLFSFKGIHDCLLLEMEKHGWQTKSKKKPEYPFYFLSSSLIWETNIKESSLKHKNSPSYNELLNSSGWLNDKVFQYLRNNPDAGRKLAHHINTTYLDF
jgi:predicted restriction endonuclease